MSESTRSAAGILADYRQDQERTLVTAMRAMAEFADTLHPDYELVDLLHQLCYRCVELLRADGASVVVADDTGRLGVVAASNERARSMERFQLRHRQGPRVDCYRDGRALSVANLTEVKDTWPAFAVEASRQRFAALDCVPMLLRSEKLGVLTLFRDHPLPIPPIDFRIAEALADVTTTAITHERAVRRNKTYAEQLEAAVGSRIVIERAKHVVSERGGIGPDEAIARMRAYAYENSRWLKAITRGVADGTLDVDAVLRSHPGPGWRKSSWK